MVIGFAGVIKLREALDRETKDVIDVVVTIQDENYNNIVPFRRQIKGSEETESHDFYCVPSSYAPLQLPRFFP